MFNLFKRKKKKEKIGEQYKKGLKEAYILSTTNRKESDLKTQEANEILKKIENLPQ